MSAGVSSPARAVLMIAYYFPPIGGPGVFRPLKFVKYLPRCGWRPLVVAGGRNDPDFKDDPGLLGDVPPEAVVERVDFPWDTPWRRLRQWLYAHRLGRIGHALECAFDFPCRFREWTARAEAVAERLIVAHRPEVLWVTAPPFSSLVLGRRLAQRHGLPWIADCRDPWSTNDFLLDSMPRWMRRRHRRVERAVLRAADCVVCTNEGLERELARVLDPGRVVVLPNGYDAGDFQDFGPPPAPGDRVRLVHVGATYGEYGPQPLREALAEAARTRDPLLGAVELSFVGGTHVAFDGLDPLKVVIEPRIGHDEALKRMRDAQVLFLAWSSSWLSTTISGKLYEYLATGRPVLAIVPPGCAAAEVVRRSGAGRVADPDRPEEILDALRRCVRVARGEEAPFARDEAYVRSFSREQLTRRLAGLLDALPGRRA